MKKITAIFLTLALIISIVACGNEKNLPEETTGTTETAATTTEKAATETTVETTAATTKPSGILKPSSKGSAAFLITNAKNKIKMLKSYVAELYSELNIQTTVTGEVITDVRTKTYNIVSDSEFSSDLKAEFGGAEYTSKVYATDEYYYVSEFGSNAKYEKSEESDAAYDDRNLLMDKMKFLPENAISEIGEREDAVIITAELDKDRALSIFKDTFEEIENSINLDDEEVLESAQKVITSTKVIIEVDRNGYMKSYTLSINFSYLIPTDGVSAAVKVAYVYSVSFDLDKEPVLDIPEGYEDFPLMTYENLPYQIVNSAIEKTLGLDDFAINEYGYVAMNFMGMSTSVKKGSSIAVKALSSETPVFRLSSATEALDQTEYLDIYYENGYYYINNNGTAQKVSKTEVDDEFSMSLLRDYLSVTLLPVSEGAATETSISPMEDGKTEIYFALSETYFILNYAGEIYDSMGEISADNITISAPELYVYVNENGFVEYYEISYCVQATTIINGVETEIYILAYEAVEFTAYGEDVTVTPPTGYQTYPSSNTNA